MEMYGSVSMQKHRKYTGEEYNEVIHELEIVELKSVSMNFFHTPDLKQPLNREDDQNCAVILELPTFGLDDASNAIFAIPVDWRHSNPVNGSE